MGASCSAPRPVVTATGRDLPPTAIGGLTMTDFPITTNPCSFPPWRCGVSTTHEEMQDDRIYCEPYPITDVFVDELAKIDRLGAVARLTFTVLMPDCCHPTESP